MTAKSPMDIELLLKGMVRRCECRVTLSFASIILVYDTNDRVICMFFLQLASIQHVTPAHEDVVV